jgi:hypothetical protein
MSFGFLLEPGQERETNLAIRNANKSDGIDVGFSKTRRTTGIACLEGDHLTLERAGTAWESRKGEIPDGFRPSVIAIDAPLLPLDADLHLHRHVELIFSHAPFHNRCKPGLSHSGVGFQFRRASDDAYAQFNSILAPSALENGADVRELGPIVETLPNAFLRVLLPEVEPLAAPKFKGGLARRAHSDPLVRKLGHRL